MRRDTRTLIKAAFATALGALSSLGGSTNLHAQSPPPYNPYPSGILPANLDSELARVRSEVQTIFGRYFAEWQALTPTPTYTWVTRQYLFQTDMTRSGYWAAY